ncbi:uncharacterized protein TNCV_1022061 [Trichonephila clavipes]|nr:uncharacterized protein TNCV_1022061 [Trichonephila clavipes]
MHGQCPVGSDSWCKCQQAVSKDKIYIDKSKGLPPNLINIIKPTYMKLCDQNLLAKCLPGKTQNSNECFNGILWKFIPKDVFVSLTILRLGEYMAVIQFNKGFQGLIDILKHFGVTVGVLTLKGFSELDETRKTDSKRHSLTVAKVARKNRLAKKKKIIKNELIEGCSHQGVNEKEGFSERTLDAEVDDPGLKKERRERWPNRDIPLPVIHERDA